MDIITSFLLTYRHIIEALEVNAHRLHLEKYSTWSDWYNKFSGKASTALACIPNFDFLGLVLLPLKSLFYLRGPTKKIQRSLVLFKVVR